MGAKICRASLFLFVFTFAFQAHSRKRSSSSRVNRSVVNFVWKNPTPCKIDSLLQAILLEEAKSFPSLSKFWQQSSLCSAPSKSKDAYVVKSALISEFKRVLNAASKSRPTEMAEAIHNKRFQRLMLTRLQELYSKYLRKELRNFNLQMSEKNVIIALDQQGYSNFKEGDIRRLVEFSVHRSASGRAYDGAPMASAAYGSVVRLGDGVGLVNRVTWYATGEPEYEPKLIADSVHGTYEVGLTTLGSDKFGAEIVGIFEVSNHGKPNKLLALNLSWTPEANNEFELSVTAWVDQHEEKFVGVSGGYKFESHPFEPLVDLFKRKKKQQALPVITTEQAEKLRSKR